MDSVETTGTVWLGLTMGCTKCHDHIFDPLTMRDYYGLYDVFNQTSEDGLGRSGQAAPAMDMSTPAELERVKTTTEKVKQVAVEAFELTKWPRPAGLLQDKLGGPAVKPYQPEGIWEEATFGKKSYVQDHGDALYHRTLYIFWRRIVGPTMLFDNAARQT